jgi:hypothetical protein
MGLVRVTKVVRLSNQECPSGLLLGDKMDKEEILEAFNEGDFVEHVKGGVYELIKFLPVKIDGVWEGHLVYKDLDTKAEYARKLNNFHNFKLA